MPRRISDGGRSRTKQSRYWCSHAVSPGCRWQPQPEFPGTGPCRQTTRQPDTLRLTHCPAPDGSTSSTFSIRRKGRSICKGELHLFHRGPAGTPSALSNGWKQTPSQRYSAEVIDIPDDLEPRDAMQRGPSTRTRETRRPWLGRDHGISREVYGVFCTPWGCNETRIVYSRAISARPESESKRGSPSLYKCTGIPFPAFRDAGVEKQE